MLAPLGIEVVPQAELGIAEADEPHATFVENALAKARHASARSGLPAFADDSGICVDALGGDAGRAIRALCGGPPAGRRQAAKRRTRATTASCSRAGAGKQPHARTTTA